MTDNLKFYDPETGAELHRVPAGAKIPKGAPFGHIRRGENGEYGAFWWRSRGLTEDLYQEQEDDVLRFTREPIAPPKPSLPTEPGSLIRAVNTEGDECAMMIRLRGGDWVGVDQDGDERHWGDDGIVSWEPMTAVPTEAWKRLSVLDPEDTRDRVDRHGDVLNYPQGRSLSGWACDLGQAYECYGPLRFADEVIY